MSEPVLKVESLTVRYFTRRGTVYAVEDVSFNAFKGDFVALVGESGSGKSTLGYALLKLVPPPGRILGKKVLIDGINILELEGEELRKARGSLISMVFQDPFATLDPIRRIGDQIAEVMVEHGVPIEEAKKRVTELLEAVNLPYHLASSYPHQLSGGQRQRVSIAAAIALNPKVLVADEPTTALDVIVQRQIMDLLDDIRRKTDMVILLITHDIALAAERASRIAVMYAGRIIEYGSKRNVIDEPLHPYTQGLLSSVPDVGKAEWPKPIPGLPPDLRNPPKGCAFKPRCPYAKDICCEKLPQLIEVEKEHYVMCWLYSS
ncbi:MAG: ABC transporter ATP-binding protein [Thermoprotei archaeon]|nr:MAG: ABC transporter ATP-binding protein [Thermoprotei archaeon]